MLIYDYQKEFVGIDESNLKTLGFSNLSQLTSEVHDFADLFVKTPGYIHNFKHVHWIDFVMCAESNQESKVIININDKNFKCNLDIKGIYLKDDPTNMGYIVNLVNLRALNQAENETQKKETKQISTVKSNIPTDFIASLKDNYEQEIPQKDYIEIAEDDSDATISIDDFDIYDEASEDSYEDDEFLAVEPEEIVLPKETKKEHSVTLYNQVLDVGSDYVYNPQLASNELGLPVELIEEFVQDFIAQANEFKLDLYNSLNDHSIDNVKILSHKLKGVAANLRIEDAFEVLTTVNTSENLVEIEQSLNTFYMIIEKLSNKRDSRKEIEIEEVLEEKREEKEDEFVLSFKDEHTEIKDADVPQKIELPELADDEFISIDLEEYEEEKVEPIGEISEYKSQEIQNKKDIQVHYDRAKAAREIGIDTKNFNELFDDFVSEAKEYIVEIKKAIEHENYEATKHSCTKLQRMCETMRIDSFEEEVDSIMKAQDAKTIEEAIKTIHTKLNLISSMEN